MQVLVTGAGGFVCSHIVVALLEAGHRVFAQDIAFDAQWQMRFNPYTQNAGLLQVITAPASHLPVMDVDVMIHGAALTSQGSLTDDQYLRANIDPFLAASAWAAKHVRMQFIAISSSAVFAKRSHPGPETGFPVPAIHDAAPCQPDSLYGQAKAFIERTMREGANAHCAAYAVRLGSIYGPHEVSRPSRQNVSVVGAMINQALQTGEILAENPFATDWTFAPDIGQAIVALLDVPVSTLRDAQPVINLTSGLQYSHVDIAQAIQHWLPNVRVVCPTGSEVSGVLAVRPPLANREIARLTGFAAWNSLRDGLGHTLAWLRADRHRLQEVC